MDLSPLLEMSPVDFAGLLRGTGARRVWLSSEPETGEIRCSRPELRPLADFLADGCSDFHAHEAIFLEVGPKTGVLFGAFIHDTRRGQAQGGVRYWRYERLEHFLRDGLRLSRGMTRKNALAGLWWGGGKGLIARRPGEEWRDPAYRETVFAEYSAFVSSLRGCYVTAEDVGTGPGDMAVIHRHTRFATSIPPGVGGAGNPSGATARGVVCAMEAALEFLELGDLSGKIVGMQGTGNVGSEMIAELLARGVRRILASDLSEERTRALSERFRGAPLEIRVAAPGDDGILREPCDLLAPNALGGVLGPCTIGGIRARVVCGAANNQLLDEERDAAALAACGITYVPDFVANRMGIVTVANEQYGWIPGDPYVERHLDRDWENSIHAVTQRVLRLAGSEGITTAAAANRLADELAAVPHPLWGHRARVAISSLVEGAWQ
ncbi:MAG: Glu/Leu/Phe/Val dehydrogenase [Deltaproteobacteria bacterium]|nr:Glu/Leu/Phe/Val dehydrogenase [Deltaproteobacteria bacterium]